MAGIVILTRQSLISASITSLPRSTVTITDWAAFYRRWERNG
ncbi:hypothetical protein BN1221_01041c [Brenneria goodwinii]|uniref:Uncharacterized protein n=1 Tax=Brenneria goodwinii TaxID=1109412 RepID=A0A0G4JSI1_9GAMM|nr:hypothetical protein BN1221_01041c [Brenneria goodwinii]